MAASNADIGVALADMYPKFTLTGMAQLISTTLATLFEGNSLQLTGTAMAQFPLLDFGRRHATVDSRREDRVQALVTYRATVLGALRDVEDALIQLQAERDRNVVLARAVADQQQSATAIEAQYRTGFRRAGQSVECADRRAQRARTIGGEQRAAAAADGGPVQGDRRRVDGNTGTGAAEGLSPWRADNRSETDRFGYIAAARKDHVVPIRDGATNVVNASPILQAMRLDSDRSSARISEILQKKPGLRLSEPTGVHQGRMPSV